MSLSRYHEKRDFTRTPEPRGKVAKSGRQLAFYIQKHHASHLHYDFRLEIGGTLKSWAIPKGPSLDPKDKRLAVQVEDHPVDYGLFEGRIPAGEYGAGDVIVWDTGVWSPLTDAEEGLRKGNLKFELQGVKLQGHWALVRMGKASQDGARDKENWLLIKENDDAARRGKEADVTSLLPDSVLDQVKKKRAAAKTGATPGVQAGAKQAAARQAGAGKKVGTPANTTAARSAATTGAAAAAMPALLQPQLATLAERPPAGQDWLCEVKFDGYRALCRIDEGAVGLYTRNGNDWTARWKPLAAAAAALPVRQAWLDGEVVAIDEDGNISFQALQNNVRHQQPERLVYYVFDLLYLNGHDLRQVPLIERRRLLQALLADADPEGPLLFSRDIGGEVGDIFHHACMHGLEGIIAKRADSPYASVRNASWLKIKCQQRQEFVIGGYTDPAGAREKFGALLLGLYDEQGALQFAGRVGTGFDAALLQSLHKQFAALSRKTSPFASQPPRLGKPALHWLRPVLVAEVRFAQWTADGVIRHASFVGLREDKAASGIHREYALPLKKLAGAATAGKGRKRSAAQERQGDNGAAAKPAASKPDREQAEVAGVTLSHPARVLYADIGFTKLDLAHYYEDIAGWILPHLEQRPMTLVRCPQGGSNCFFQKHVNATTSELIEQIAVPGKGAGAATYMTASTLPALIAMVQMGVLELHTWGAREGKLDRPDRIIFDLDPAPGLAWSNVVEAAQLIRALLDEIGLQSFVKTTGGKGLHVVAPIVPQLPWEEVKAFTRAIAEHLERQMPERFTANMAKAKRKGRIFVDYLRNGLEATAVAAYSTRARPGAPVSVPVDWEELEGELRADSFNALSLPARLAHLKHDPWESYFTLKQKISVRMRKTFS